MKIFVFLTFLSLYINLIFSARVRSKSELDCSPHHNDHRKNLLDHNEDLAETALKLARIYEVNELSGRKTEGINYYTEDISDDNEFDDDYICEAAISSWFNEVNRYNSLNSDNKIKQNKNKYFHYLQLSWNTTKSVGCGYARSNNRFTVACVYKNKINFDKSIKKHVPVNSFEKEILRKNHKDLCHLGPVFYDYTQPKADKVKVHDKVTKVKKYCATRKNYDDYDNDDDDDDDYNDDDDDKKRNQNRNKKNNTKNNDAEFKRLNEKLDHLEKLVQNLKKSENNNNNNSNNSNSNKNRPKKKRIVRRRLIPFPF